MAAIALACVIPHAFALSPSATFAPAGCSRPSPPLLAPTLRYALPTMQAPQGPLEEGFKEILPFATADGNVDPELVDRVNDEVFAITGVGLEDLLNPSKVVNYEREKILLTQQISECADATERGELQQRLTKVEKQLYSEKRTVFSGALKAVFIGQALIAIVLGGFAAFDAFPWFTIDLSLRALGFWSFWLFIIPSLRARRPRGWEKLALNIAFIGSPIVTIGAPFLTKSPPLIWELNLALLVGCYAYAFAVGRGDEAEEAASFTGALRWLDFGSGQERGIRGAARERYFDKQRAGQEGADAASDEREVAAAGASGQSGEGNGA